jgi:hypothetical protein
VHVGCKRELRGDHESALAWVSEVRACGKRMIRVSGSLPAQMMSPAAALGKERSMSRQFFSAALLVLLGASSLRAQSLVRDFATLENGNHIQIQGMGLVTGVVEKEGPIGQANENSFRLVLKEPNRDTARIIARSINKHAPYCALVDGGSIIVHIPVDRQGKTSDFTREVCDCPLNPVPARRGEERCTGQRSNTVRSQSEFWNWIRQMIAEFGS